MATSLLPAQSILVVIANGGIERQEQDGRRINNIGVANIVILKWPTLQVTTPVTGTVAKLLTQQLFRNLKGFNKKII